ncbi:hypothetical protein CEXT_56881 [Caerostris extrusa]|uniref:Uncharacterized protein n=1 Tax=Caerostris extrusa TaxID=172846 RepID=A0AAV4PXS8_CAEEX|nr:hypothetical protein CEXT_56881 [Caerostris extrusa]
MKRRCGEQLSIIPTGRWISATSERFCAGTVCSLGGRGEMRKKRQLEKKFCFFGSRDGGDAQSPELRWMRMYRYRPLNSTSLPLHPLPSFNPPPTSPCPLEPF